MAIWGTLLPPDFVYRSLIDRPYDALSQWDKLLLEGNKIVMIGAADAHEYRFAGIVIAPYEMLFKFVRTHVLLPLSTLPNRDAILQALRTSKAYFAMDMLMNSRGFSFWVENNGVFQGTIGDSLNWEIGQELHVKLPTAADIRLIHNGIASVKSNQVSHMAHQLDQKGIYRVEVFLNGLLWIASNPIYVE